MTNNSYYTLKSTPILEKVKAHACSFLEFWYTLRLVLFDGKGPNREVKMKRNAAFWYEFLVWLCLYDLIMLPLVASVIPRLHNPHDIGVFIIVWVSMSLVLSYAQTWVDLVFKQRQ